MEHDRADAVLVEHEAVAHGMHPVGADTADQLEVLHRCRFGKFDLTIVTVVWLATVLLMTADLPTMYASISHDRRQPHRRHPADCLPLYIVGVGVWRTLTGPPGGGDELAMPSTMHA